jgi:hypothetical protein
MVTAPNLREAKAMLQRWKYQDARGVWCVGTFQGFSDFGGTDVTYRFRQDDGTLNLVRGAALKTARNITVRPEAEGPFCPWPRRTVADGQAYGRNWADYPRDYSGPTFTAWD